MLHFVLSPKRAPEPAPTGSLWDFTDTFFWSQVRIFGHRTPRYFASVSMRRRPTALVIPLGSRHLERPYLTTPRFDSILPPGQIESFTRHDHAHGTAILMRYGGGYSAAMVALRNVVVWLSNTTLSPLGIQNDNVISPKGRTVSSAAGRKTVPALVAMKPFPVDGPWLNVDDQLGLIAQAGFRYIPAGRYTRRSAAEDLVVPLRGKGGTCLLVAPRYSAAETQRLAEVFRVEREDGVHTVQFRDGPDGPLMCVDVSLGEGVRTARPASIATEGSVAPGYPLQNLADDDPMTFTVLRNGSGKGPTPDAPVIVEFSMPEKAGTPRALRIVPRPRYGPREVALEVRRRATWQRTATAQLGSGLKDLALEELGGVERLRLVISKGWDRGEQQSASPRNTQIAELSFLLAEPAGEAESEAKAPFVIRGKMMPAKGEKPDA